MQYQIHEEAELYPMMAGETFESFVEDIKENGQEEPILVYQGKIIDGRNRYMACQRLGIEPKVIEWDGQKPLRSFLKSMNFHRRHLTKEQLATIGVERLLPDVEAKAQQRIVEGAKIGAQITNTGERPVTKLSQGEGPGEKSRDIVAKMLGVSPSYISDAKRIQKDAPEVFDMMKRGDVNIPDAKRLTNMSEETRGEAIENMRNEVVGETKCCMVCGKLLPLEKFYKTSEKRELHSRCHSCRHKEQWMSKHEPIKERHEPELEQNLPVDLVGKLKQRNKDLEAKNKELQEKIKGMEEKLNNYEIENYELRSRLMVIKAKQDNIFERAMEQYANN